MFNFNLPFSAWTKKAKGVTIIFITVIIPAPVYIAQTFDLFKSSYHYIENTKFGMVGILDTPSRIGSKQICLSNNNSKVELLDRIGADYEQFDSEEWQRVRVLDGKCKDTEGYVHLGFIKSSENT